MGGYANLALLAVQGIVLVPLYLEYLGPRLYGAWLGSGDVLGWLGVLDLGVASFMVQRIAAAHGRGDSQAVGDYLATGIVVQVLLVALLVAGAAVIAPFLPRWMGVEEAEAVALASAFFVAAVGTAFGILNNGIAGFALALQLPGFSNVAAFCSSLVGIGATVYLLVQGWSLWALAAGMVIRNGLLLLANICYGVRVYFAEVGSPLRPRRAMLREVWSLSTPALLSSVGSAAVGRSEAALIAIFLRPELATVYVLTRRAAEIAAMFLARIGGSVFPGFAHLVGTGNREQAERVRAEITRVYLSLGVLLISLYLALNKTFMALWVGAEQYAGHVLTVLIGGSVLLTGFAGVAAYLFSATGKIAESAYLIFSEAGLRLVLMAVLLYVFGLAGLPLAALITASGLAFLAVEWTRRALAAEGDRRWTTVVREHGIHALLLLGSVLVGTVRWGSSWMEFIQAGALMLVLVSGLLAVFDPFSRELFRDRVLPHVRRALRA